MNRPISVAAPGAGLDNYARDREYCERYLKPFAR
jgi:hypothetical protein